MPDGIGLLLAARLRGERFREHVRGTDLVHRLAALGAARGHRWYLLGAADGVARQGGRPPPGPVSGPEHRRRRARLAAPRGRRGDLGDDPRGRPSRPDPGRVRRTGPGALAGAQPRSARRSRSVSASGACSTSCPAQVPRAPAWMRRLELEWLHRLIVQPWRWRRQLELPRFVGLAAIEAARRAAGRQTSRYSA